MYTVDDAYITLRQARNLVEGYGLVYNPGGDIVESYTNHLLFLYQAAVLYMGFDGLFWTKVLGVLSGLVTLFASMGIVYQLLKAGGETEEDTDIPISGCSAAALILSLSPILFSGSVSGLETSFFTAFVTLSALAMLRLCLSKPDRISLIITGTLLGLATWVRPEGIAWAIGFLLFSGLILHRSKEPLKPILIITGIVLLFWLSLTIYRMIVFGHPFPNTYYAKMGRPFSSRIAGGIAYTREFLFASGGWILMLLGITAVVLSKGKQRWLSGMMLAAGTSGVLLAAYEGGDWIPYLRLICPSTGILTGLAVFGVMEAGRRVPKAGPALCLILPLLIWQLYFYTSMQGLRNAGAEIQTRIFGWNDSHKPMGIWLGEWNETHREKYGAPLSIAIEDIGLVGWYSEANIVDLAGLADPYWAHLHYEDPEQLYPAGHLLNERNPDVIVIVSVSGNREEPLNVPWRTNRAIYTHPVFGENYIQVVMFTHKDYPNDGLFLHVFARKEIATEAPDVEPPAARASGR